MQTYEEVRGEPLRDARSPSSATATTCATPISMLPGQFRFRLKIAAPESHRPDNDLLADTDNAELVESPRAAVENADLVVTDVWSSMGHDEEAEERHNAFDGYQVSPSLLDFANEDAIFMHCLPAHRGEEISDDLFEDPRSVVFTEAGNRLHSQKALLEFLLADSKRVTFGARDIQRSDVEECERTCTHSGPESKLNWRLNVSGFWRVVEDYLHRSSRFPLLAQSVPTAPRYTAMNP